MTEHLYLMIIASVIGIVGGLGAVGIKRLIHLISDISFYSGNNVIESVLNTPWWLVILIPAIGGFIVGPLTHFFASEAKGHGVPEVMNAVITKGGVIKAKVGLIKAITSSITIGTGGSVGKEGPIIQIGAAIGSSIGQFLKVPTSRLKVLVGCGAAAGIAGAFNAPVAGALFAIEVILMDFGVSSFSPIVISSVLATVVSHSFDGDFIAFSVMDFKLINGWEVVFYMILGVLSGLFSYLFIKVLYYFEDLWDEKIKIKPYLKAGFGGLIIGSLALFFPEIIGTGYDAIDTVINGKPLTYLGLGHQNFDNFFTYYNQLAIIAFVFIMIFVKIFATSITLGSGGSGGVFAPSLFIGAMVGAFWGYLVNLLFPNITANSGSYALVGMGGLVAGTTRAPITAILIIFELTKETSIILPLMITCIGSIIISSNLSRESIYTLKLIKKKINIKDRSEINILKGIFVSDVYTKDFEYVLINENFSNIIYKLINQKLPFISVLDENKKYYGMISLNEIKEFLFQKDELDSLLIAGDIANFDIPTINLNDDCKKVNFILNEKNLDCLPVINEDNIQIGLLWRNDLDYIYNKELDRLELSSDLASKISVSNFDEEVAFLEGYALCEINVPKSFIGKSLAELKIRNNYGVDVLSIKQINPHNDLYAKENVKAIPEANHIFNEFDKILIAGEKKKIKLFKQL